MLPVDPSNMKGVQRFNKANLGERQKKMGNVNQQLVAFCHILPRALMAVA